MSEIRPVKRSKHVYKTRALKGGTTPRSSPRGVPSGDFDAGDPWGPLADGRLWGPSVGHRATFPSAQSPRADAHHHARQLRRGGRRRSRYALAACAHFSACSPAGIFDGSSSMSSSSYSTGTMCAPLVFVFEAALLLRTSPRWTAAAGAHASRCRCCRC